MELFALSGLRSENFPDEYQTDLLISFIREDLGNFSIKDFKIAFRLAMKGDLEIDPNHYQAFSAVYLGKIMRAYVPIRSATRNALKSNENALKIDSSNQMTDQEKEQLRKDYIFESIIKPWRYYLKRNALTFGITPYRIVYETLTLDLKILNIETERKREIYLEAVDKIQQDLNKQVTNMDEYRKLNILRDKVKAEGIDKAMEFEIKSLCYEISVKEFYLQCKQNNVDLESLVMSNL